MTTINLDGVVGWDIDAKEFAECLDALSGDISFELNSGGGFVTDGIAILNKIRAYSKGKTTANISYAASMMTQIALACDEVNVYDNGIFMIHNVQGIVVGDHNDMKESADLQERMSNMLAQLYVKKTGKSIEEIKEMMDADTYLFGQEIIDAGFADNIIDTDYKKDKEVAMADSKVMFQKVKKAMKQEKLSLEAMKNNFEQCQGDCNLGVNQHRNKASVTNHNQKQGDSMSKTYTQAEFTALEVSHAEALGAINTDLSAAQESLQKMTDEKATAVDALATLQATVDERAAFSAEAMNMAHSQGVDAPTLVKMATANTLVEAKAFAMDGMNSDGGFQSSNDDGQASADAWAGHFNNQ